ncbi:MAG: 50S ribosomal protein L34e [Candidatus Woesearchaeota archaeon]
MQPHHFKSRSLRKVSKRTPGGRTTTHFEKKKPKVARCAICKKPLSGIPRNVKKLSKSEKTVERKYGGNLCSKCSRRKIITEARGE